MVLQAISVPSKATTGVAPGQPRADHTEPVDASGRTQGDRRTRVAAPAVVVQFGLQALGLARSPLTPNPNAALTAADVDGESLQGSVFGPSETNAALLDALDSNARRERLLAAGTTEPESGPLDQPPNTPQSGFFRSSSATGAESLLASDGLDDGLDWLFPGSPSSRALDSAFARPDVDFAVEPTFMELPSSTIPSLSSAPSAPRASAFFSSAHAAPTGAATTIPATAFDASQLRAEHRHETQTLERSARQGRADERVQRAALAGYASSVQLRYEVGPDGRRYLVEAEVPFDVTAVPGDPAATLHKMEAIRRATSSGSPSSSPRKAAAEAAQLAMRARAQLAAERYAEAQGLEAKRAPLEAVGGSAQSAGAAPSKPPAETR